VGVQLEIVHASTNREIDDVFAKFSIQRPDALFVSGDFCSTVAACNWHI
jgi:hypothetical protein